MPRRSGTSKRRLSLSPGPEQSILPGVKLRRLLGVFLLVLTAVFVVAVGCKRRDAPVSDAVALPAVTDR